MAPASLLFSVVSAGVNRGWTSHRHHAKRARPYRPFSFPFTPWAVRPLKRHSLSMLPSLHSGERTYIDLGIRGAKARRSERGSAGRIHLRKYLERSRASEQQDCEIGGNQSRVRSIGRRTGCEDARAHPVGETDSIHLVVEAKAIQHQLACHRQDVGERGRRAERDWRAECLPNLPTRINRAGSRTEIEKTRSKAEDRYAQGRYNIHF